MDPSSGVTFEAFVMHRRMEMYQWQEHKSETRESSDDGTETRKVTSYSYSKQWSTSYQNSAHFKQSREHHNPQISAFMAAQQGDAFFYASGIKLGQYALSKSIESFLKNGVDLEDITQRVFDGFYAADRETRWQMQFGFIYAANQEGHAAWPNIGDVRVKWSAIDLEGYSATFLGSLTPSGQLGKYESANQDEYVWLKVGRTDTIPVIIASFHADNAGTLNLFRGVSLLMMCVGFVCTSQMVNYLLSFVPICGNLLGCGLNIMAVIVGAVFWFLFFLIAYLSARKEIAIALIVVVVAGLLAMQRKAAGTTKEGEAKSD